MTRPEGVALEKCEAGETLTRRAAGAQMTRRDGREEGWGWVVVWGVGCGVVVVRGGGETRVKAQGLGSQ